MDGMYHGRGLSTTLAPKRVLRRLTTSSSQGRENYFLETIAKGYFQVGKNTPLFKFMFKIILCFEVHETAALPTKFNTTWSFHEGKKICCSNESVLLHSAGKATVERNQGSCGFP